MPMPTILEATERPQSTLQQIPVRIPQIRMENPPRFMSLHYIDYVDAQNIADIVLEIEEDTADWNEPMSQYLDDQSSIIRYPYIAQDQSANEAHYRFNLSGFDDASVAVVSDWEAPLFLLPIIE